MSKPGAITTRRLVLSATVAKSGTWTSEGIDLREIANNGVFGLQIELSGDGTGKGEYLCSLNGEDYLEPATAADIFTGLVKTGGPGSDGKAIYSFNPEPTRFIQIRVTETGGANAIVITVYLLVQ